jgi:hypothetical protein
LLQSVQMSSSSSSVLRCLVAAVHSYRSCSTLRLT